MTAPDMGLATETGELRDDRGGVGVCLLASRAWLEPGTCRLTVVTSRCEIP